MMNDLGQHLFEMLNEQNEAYRRAFESGRQAGYREGFRDGTAAAQDRIREMLAPPAGDPPSVSP
jgi:flagellar biosynthesis/type III secretory pathway protein FliH